jgi:hypothetical protein
MTERIGLGMEVTKRTGSVMVAEGVGIATSLGSLLLVKKIAGPERMAAAKEQVAQDVILPLLNRIDATLGKFQKMRDKMARGGEESSPEQKEDPFAEEKLPPVERARRYANTLLDMAIMMPVGVVTRILAQSKSDDLFKAPQIEQKHYLYAKVPDFVANNVALVAMNTVAKAPSQAVAGVMEKVLAGVGVPKESAKSMATYLTYVQGSNLIGNMANVGYVTAVSRKQQASQPPENGR